MSGLIDTDRFSDTMRTRGIDREQRLIRITNFHDSDQEHDLSEPANCGGFGRLRHFRRGTREGWPENPLPIDPAARALGTQAAETTTAQVFQNAVCNWRCWYCFVDFALLSGDPRHSSLLSPSEIVDLYLAVASRPCVIDLSGGQPDLVPEWIAWMLAELRGRRISDVYVWSDDNLSNDYFFTHLSADERALIEADRSYGKVCCFKGFDANSFSFNTKAEPGLFDRQFTLMTRLIAETPLDIYGYVTLTSPDSQHVAVRMSDFLDRLQEVDRNLPLRTIPLEVTVFTPVESRLAPEHSIALEVQQEAVAAWTEELSKRFDPDERALSVCDVPLRR